MTLVLFPKDGKLGLTEEADPTQLREGVMKMNVSRRTIKHRPPSRNGPKCYHPLRKDCLLWIGFERFLYTIVPPCFIQNILSCLSG